jgi:hypothetical protein
MRAPLVLDAVARPLDARGWDLSLFVPPSGGHRRIYGHLGEMRHPVESGGVPNQPTPRSASAAAVRGSIRYLAETL